MTWGDAACGEAAPIKQPSVFIKTDIIMPQTLHCPHCHGVLAVADEDAGYRLTCPHCSKDFVAPGNPASQHPSSTGQDDQDDWLQLESSSSPKPTPKKKSKPPANPPLSRSPAPGPDGSDNSFLDDFTASTESLPGTQPDSNTENPFSDLPDFAAPPSAPPAPVTGSPLAAAAGAAASGTPAVPSAPGAPRKEPEYAKEYRVKCLICGTQTYVKDHQAGTSIPCVDCHTPIKVPPPPRLKQKPDMTPLDQVQSIPMQKALEVRRPKPQYEKSAAELLEAAQSVEPSTSQPSDLDNPDIKQWAKSVFGIFVDPGVVVHFVILSVMAAVPCYIAAQGLNPVLIIGVFIIVAMCFVAVLACGFAILESVANGEKRVQQWPIFDPLDWFTPAITVAAAAGLVLAPVNAIVGTLLGGAPLLLLAANFLAFYAAFPFVLLSMLDMGTIMMPFSAEVSRSITKCQEAWGGFYFSSGGLFIGTFLLILSLVSGGGSAGIVMSVFLVTGLLFTYFAMLGRLAYAIGQVVNAPAREAGGDAPSTTP